MLAQRAHAHQLHLTLKDVDQHRQLVDPQLPEHGAPSGDAVVVVELSTRLQLVVLIDVGLQVFGVGIHRSELIHPDPIAVLTDAV